MQWLRWGDSSIHKVIFIHCQDLKRLENIFFFPQQESEKDAKLREEMMAPDEVFFFSRMWNPNVVLQRHVYIKRQNYKVESWGADKG